MLQKTQIYVGQHKKSSLFFSFRKSKNPSSKKPFLFSLMAM